MQEVLNFENASLATGQNFLQSLPQHIGSAGLLELVEYFEATNSIYETFPELELLVPRNLVATKLKQSAQALPEEPAILLLMFAAALSPTSRLAGRALLEQIGQTRSAIVFTTMLRLLTRYRDFSWNDVRGAVIALRRRDMDGELLSVVPEILSSVHSDKAAGRALVGVSRKRREDEKGRSTPRESRHRGKLQSSTDSAVANLSEIIRKTSYFGFATQTIGIQSNWLPSMKVGEAGRRLGSSITTTKEIVGMVAYGPYFKLAAGKYRAHADLRLESVYATKRPFRKGRELLIIEAVCVRDTTHHYFGTLSIREDELPAGNHGFEFTVPEVQSSDEAYAVELRVITKLPLAATLSSIRVERLG